MAPEHTPLDLEERTFQYQGRTVIDLTGAGNARQLLEQERPPERRHPRPSRFQSALGCLLLLAVTVVGLTLVARLGPPWVFLPPIPAGLYILLAMRSALGPGL